MGVKPAHRNIVMGAALPVLPVKGPRAVGFFSVSVSAPLGSVGMWGD